jgi:hypothetical protein
MFLPLVVALAAMLSFTGGEAPALPTLTVRLVPGEGDRLTQAAFDLEGLTPGQLAGLGSEPAVLRGLFDVRRDEASARVLVSASGSRPVSGAFRKVGPNLRFVPSGPLDRGVRYRAVVRPAALTDRLPPPGPITVFYTLPPEGQR